MKKQDLINLRINKEDKIRIKRMAEKNRLPLSEFIRRRIFNEKLLD